MPELPEVEAARALIARAALRREITAVDDADTYVCRPHAPGELADALTGRTLTAANRIGKSLWVETDEGEGPSLGLHLGMAGRILIDGAVSADADTAGGSTRAERPLLHAGDPLNASEAQEAEQAGGHPDPRLSGNPAWARFTVEFADGGRLILFDKRRLGRAVLNPDLAHLGPDAAEITVRAFRERVGRGDAPLKARIMDQSVLAGVGNLLADEALWRARLSPVRPAGELDDGELDRLRRAIRAATRDAIRRGGVHTGALIGHRRRDGRCPRCDAPLVRAQVGGRTTWWCPEEQP